MKDEGKCKCGKEAQPSHTCPYQEDINNDHEFKCNCCEDCEEQCCMDI